RLAYGSFSSARGRSSLRATQPSTRRRARRVAQFHPRNAPRPEARAPVRMKRGKILVIRGGAIGDFVLTLPAIAALRRHFPDAHLEVLGYPHIIELALAGGLVERAQSVEARSLAGFFARHGDLAEELADYFSEFDLVVSYLYDPHPVFEHNVGRCKADQFIAGPHW